MTMEPSRRHPPRPILAVSTVVFRAGRVLLGERTKEPAAGCFSLPGGLVELGETLEAAALRELAEETGVVARIGGLAAHTDVIARDANARVERHFVVVTFWADWLEGEAMAGEDTAAVVWADPAALEGWRTTPGLQAVLEKAVAARTAAAPPR